MAVNEWRVVVKHRDGTIYSDIGFGTDEDRARWSFHRTANSYMHQRRNGVEVRLVSPDGSVEVL